MWVVIGLRLFIFYLFFSGLFLLNIVFIFLMNWEFFWNLLYLIGGILIRMNLVLEIVFVFKLFILMIVVKYVVVKF